MISMPSNVMDKRFAAPKRDLDYALDRLEAMSSLSKLLCPRQREAVRLFYLTGLSLEDICARLGMEAPQAHRLLGRAEKRLRELAHRFYPELHANGNGR